MKKQTNSGDSKALSVLIKYVTLCVVVITYPFVMIANGPVLLGLLLSVVVYGGLVVTAAYFTNIFKIILAVYAVIVVFVYIKKERDEKILEDMTKTAFGKKKKNTYSSNRFGTTTSSFGGSYNTGSTTGSTQGANAGSANQAGGSYTYAFNYGAGEKPDELRNLSFFGMSEQDARDKYLRLVKKYHPDNGPGNEEMFKLLSEEYAKYRKRQKMYKKP